MALIVSSVFGDALYFYLLVINVPVIGYVHWFGSPARWASQHAIMVTHTLHIILLLSNFVINSYCCFFEVETYSSFSSRIQNYAWQKTEVVFYQIKMGMCT